MTGVVNDLQRYITDEFLIALGLSPRGRARFWLEPVLSRATRRFARMMADFDRDVARTGPAQAARGLLLRFVKEFSARGTERLPAEGPLVVASNHPGAYDGLALTAGMGRDDLKLVASDVNFLRRLPAASRHLIFVTHDIGVRAVAVREMVRHLRAGGALLVFATGLVDPDPDLEPGSEQALARWSPSLALALRRVPETRVVPAIVSGVLARACLRHPLTRLAKEEWEKRKLAEFLQVSQQLALGRDFALRPRVSFGEPVGVHELRPASAPNDIMSAIIAHARAVLAAHMAANVVYTDSARSSLRKEL